MLVTVRQGRAPGTAPAPEKSAAKLGIDQIDLLILHQALPAHFDRTMQAYRALETLLGRANVRAIGGITFYREGQHTSTLEDPTIVKIADAHGKSPAQGHAPLAPPAGPLGHPEVDQGAHGIAENFDVFDFDLGADELAVIDALDTDKRRGPEPEDITLEAYGMPIPEAD